MPPIFPIAVIEILGLLANPQPRATASGVTKTMECGL
jgi:hypothetical protein